MLVTVVTVCHSNRSREGVVARADLTAHHDLHARTAVVATGVRISDRRSELHCIWWCQLQQTFVKLAFQLRRTHPISIRPANGMSPLQTYCQKLAM